ncbi:LOW QUALITY PROTEIN: uncharacterized protein LOC119086729 [Peromyscus leucopus]|uniref:LOW QUALITY PROTEIN: uncharacterized protein LOC119086729 n=1 Tax=Peromyscus leucopus TaxID=10041 RepID=UPI001884B9DA|nr:LOW QUALITY PROTEIN: uncharacterized protein LOC119086729 [Peromyscus leucopus]
MEPRATSLHHGWTEAFPTKKETANVVTKKLLDDIFPRDWVLLLPLALYQARNTPGPHGLTPFEIMYGAPPPIVNFLHPDISSFATSPTLEAHLQALQLVQKTVWKPLADAYREQLNRPVVPHPFKIGDSVWVRRHQSRNLEPRWKGPYTVLLTTPTALKIDGIAAWVYASHVKAAKEPNEAESTSTEHLVQRSPNPLKIRLTRGPLDPPNSPPDIRRAITREPVSLTLALLLGGITMGRIAARVDTGTADLMETGQFRQLQVAINTDIKALEESVSALEKSLTSLSEVVLPSKKNAASMQIILE